MQIIRPLNSQSISRSVAITLGKFDGVHRGHQTLFKQLTTQARQDHLLAGAIIFEPHANEYFAQKNQHQFPARLTGLSDKIRMLQQQALDFVAIYQFNEQSIAISAEQFIQDYLLTKFNIKHILIGDDFRFGAGRQGDTHLLNRYGAAYGFKLMQMPTYTEGQERISSTAIKNLLQKGQTAQANQLLGYHYFITGRVMHGKQLGRELGTPTANIRYSQNCLPLSGVYLSWLQHKQQLYPSITHIGYNKTLIQPNTKLQVETHILGQRLDIYGAKVKLSFIQKLRDEQKFASIAALQQAIEQDKHIALDYFERNH